MSLPSIRMRGGEPEAMWRSEPPRCTSNCRSSSRLTMLFLFLVRFLVLVDDPLGKLVRHDVVVGGLDRVGPHAAGHRAELGLVIYDFHHGNSSPNYLHLPLRIHSRHAPPAGVE